MVHQMDYACFNECICKNRKGIRPGRGAYLKDGCPKLTFSKLYIEGLGLFRSQKPPTKFVSATFSSYQHPLDLSFIMVPLFCRIVAWIESYGKITDVSQRVSKLIFFAKILIQRRWDGVVGGEGWG